MMRIEEQIALRLQQGAAPSQLIAEGFRKSTVYKVLNALKVRQAPTPAPLVLVQLTTDRDRYLPGATAQASFTVTNNSAADLYVFQAGVRPEWVAQNQWIPTTIRKLLGPSASTVVRLSLPIPSDLTLGEKDLFFGVQGQWVGPQSTSPSSEVMWTNPMLIRVQRPWTGIKVFLAHSVFDMSLVSQLETTLDDNGVATATARANLEGPATQAIDGADFLIAVITHPSRLEAVLAEIAHARSRRKELILLRDLSLASIVPSAFAGLPWVDLNFSLGPASILTFLFSKLNESIAKRTAARKKEQEDAIAAMILALGALAAGVAIAKGKSPGA
jgi:hypothetical protein